MIYIFSESIFISFYWLKITFSDRLFNMDQLMDIMHQAQ